MLVKKKDFRFYNVQTNVENEGKARNFWILPKVKETWKMKV